MNNFKKSIGETIDAMKAETERRVSWKDHKKENEKMIIFVNDTASALSQKRDCLKDKKEQTLAIESLQKKMANNIDDHSNTKERIRMLE